MFDAEVAQETIAIGTRLADYDEERYIREMARIIAIYATRSEGCGVASLIMASALAMRVGTQTKPFGYPALALALALFLAAFLLGVGLVVSAWRRDRNAVPRGERRK